MAHLWERDPDTDWAPRPLPEGEPSFLGPDRDGGPVLMPCRLESGEAWVLLSRPAAGVRVNGVPVVAGISVLDDRDEIRVGSARQAYFSTECLARIVPFSGAGREVACPRCRLALVAGSPAVQCPHCGVWHHQSDEYPCWTYCETCALCEQSTDLSAGYTWTPEGL